MQNMMNTQKKEASDEHIIDLYWERNETAIVLTKEKYGRFLYRIAFNILHNRLDCEECQNDTYLGAWNAIPPNRPNVFSAFLSKIMRNIACNKYKENTRKKRITSEMTVSMEELEGILHSGEDPDEEYRAEELGKCISEYLETLNDRQQYIFIGRFYMCDKLEDIARELHVNVSTVHRDIEKIRQGLRAYLERSEIYV